MITVKGEQVRSGDWDVHSSIILQHTGGQEPTKNLLTLNLCGNHLCLV